ncbi:MAG: type II toxin-antitoxin system HicA family toxin [Gallionella sp.]|nr:type II toxin-antitoxin system HicA family toxin [Gallionella sp.]
MNSAQRKTLEAIFAAPMPKNLEWARMESLFAALGCVTIEGNGSRVRFDLHGVTGTFHRPHPAKEAKTYQLKDVRLFLSEAGVKA